MTIELKCPSCQASLRAPNEMAGRRAKCRNCGSRIQVPVPQADLWPPGMAPPGQSSRPAQPQARPASPPAATPAPRDGKPTSPPARPASPRPAPQKPLQALPAVAVPVEPLPDGTASGARPVVSAGLGGQGPKLLADVGQLPHPSQRDPSSPNPFQSPQARDTVPVGQPDQRGIARIEFGETLRTTWELFKANLAACAGATLLTGVSAALAQFANRQVMVGLATLLGANGILTIEMVYGLMAVTLAVFVAIATVAVLALTQFSLGVARGMPAMSELHRNLLALVIPGIALLTVIGVATLLGTVLVIVGSWLVAILLSLAPFALVDRREGTFAALQQSVRLVAPNLLPATLLLLAAAFVGGVLAIFTCGIAMVVTVPFQFLLLAVIYLRATGQPTAIDRTAKASADR